MELILSRSRPAILTAAAERRHLLHARAIGPGVGARNIAVITRIHRVGIVASHSKVVVVVRAVRYGVSPTAAGDRVRLSHKLLRESSLGVPYVVEPLNRTKGQRDRDCRIVGAAGLRFGLVPATSLTSDCLCACVRHRREIAIPDQLAWYPRLPKDYGHNSAIRRGLHPQRMQDGRLLRQRRPCAMSETKK